MEKENSKELKYFINKSRKTLNQLLDYEESELEIIAHELKINDPSKIIGKLNYIKKTKEKEPTTFYKIDYSETHPIKNKNNQSESKQNSNTTKNYKAYKRNKILKKHMNMNTMRKRVKIFSNSRTRSLLFAFLITMNIIIFCFGFWASWYFNAKKSLENVIMSTSEELILQSEYFLQKLVVEKEILLKTLKTSYEYGALNDKIYEEGIDENLAMRRILKIMKLNEFIHSIVIFSEELNNQDNIYQEIFRIKNDKEKKYYLILNKHKMKTCEIVEIIEDEIIYSTIRNINCPEIRYLNKIANLSPNGSWSSPTQTTEKDSSMRIFCIKSDKKIKKMTFCLKFYTYQYSLSLYSIDIPSLGNVYILDHNTQILYATSNSINIDLSDLGNINPLDTTDKVLINTYNILVENNFFDINKKRKIIHENRFLHMRAKLTNDVNKKELLVIVLFEKNIYFELINDAQYITISISFICVLLALSMAMISYYVAYTNTKQYNLNSESISAIEYQYDSSFEFYTKANIFQNINDIPIKKKEILIENLNKNKNLKATFPKILAQTINERAQKMINLMIILVMIFIILAVLIYIIWHNFTNLSMKKHEDRLNYMIVNRMMQSTSDYTKISKTISSVIRDHIKFIKEKVTNITICNDFLENMLRITEITYFNYHYHVHSLFISLDKNTLCSASWNEDNTQIYYIYQNEKNICITLANKENKAIMTNCNFISGERIWYKAINDHMKLCEKNEICLKDVIFSRLYPSIINNVKVSTVCFIELTNKLEILGIACADINLKDYGENFLGLIADKKTKLFILNEDLILVTSSLGIESNATSIEFEEFQPKVKGYNFFDEVIASTSKFIYKRWDGDINNVTENVRIHRAIEQPMTWISNTTNKNWKIVFTADSIYLFGSSDSLFALAFIMCIFASLITITCVSSSFTKWKQDYKESTKRTKEYEELFGVVDITEEGLETLLGRIKSEVLRAFKNSWSRKYPKSGMNPNNEHRYKRAQAHVKDAENGKNILRQCILDTPALGKYPLFIFNIQANYLYRLSIYVTVFTHIIIGFWDPPSNAVLVNGMDPWIYIVEGFCIFIQIIDIIGRIFVLYKEQFQIKKILKIKNETIHNDIHCTSMNLLKLEKHKINFLTDPKMKIVYSIRCIFIVLLLIDLILKSILRWSFEYYLPIRPFIIIFMSRTLRRSSLMFIKTIIKIVDALILFAVAIMVSSIMALILFRGLINTGVVNSSFDNYIRSVMTMFVFISSGENYPNIVYPSIENNLIYLPFFLIWSLFGLFVIVAIVTGVFQDGFSELQKSELKKRNLRKRVGLLSAFVLLDENMDDKISRNEFFKFMKTLKQNISDEHIHFIFNILDKNNDKDQLDIKEFVNGIEETSIRVILSERTSSAPNLYPIIFLRVWFVEMSWWNILLVVLLLCDAFVLSLYGLNIPSKLLDLVGTVLLYVFVFDVILKFIVFGPSVYWYWAYYHKPGLFQMFANRSEIIITFISLLVFVISVLFNTNNIILRFSLSIILLRLFTQIKRLRYIIFSIFQLIPPFSSLLLLLLVLCYFYGYLGMGIFSGKYILLDNGIPLANFDNLSRSMITLYQLTIGESWHDVMYNTILATNFLSAWYFISFIFLVNLLYTSLVFGLILSIFGVLVKSDQKEITSKELDRIIESTN